MSDDSDFEQYEDDLEVEITDLDAQAASNREENGEQSSMQPAARRLLLPTLPPLLRQHRPVSVRQLRIAGVAIVGFLLLALLVSSSGLLSALLGLGHTSQLTTSPAQRVSQSASIISKLSQVDGLSCLIDAGWSPDSSRVAVVGYSYDCPVHQNYEQGLVNLYDGQTGKHIAQLRPDKQVLAALKQRFPSSPPTIPIISYQNVTWSPDGRSIALVFVAYFPSDSSAPVFEGVTLFQLTRQPVQTVFLMQQPAISSLYYLLWNLPQGTATVVNAHTPLSAEVTSSLRPALAYRWLPNGSFVPVSSDLSAPIGNPDGDSTFTPWQSGSLARVTESGDKPFQLPGIYVWATFFTAWSPDGRYLATQISLLGRVTWPGQQPPSSQSLVALGAVSLGTLPARDRAFKTLADSLPVTQNGSISLNIAWRPDGHVLATYDSGNVDLYDCVTGQKLASLVPNQGNSLDLSGTQGVLRWSPDGSHLLLSSSTWGPVALWGPDQLPHMP